MPTLTFVDCIDMACRRTKFEHYNYCVVCYLCHLVMSCHAIAKFLCHKVIIISAILVAMLHSYVHRPAPNQLHAW